MFPKLAVINIGVGRAIARCLRRPVALFAWHQCRTIHAPPPDCIIILPSRPARVAVAGFWDTSTQL